MQYDDVIGIIVVTTEWYARETPDCVEGSYRDLVVRIRKELDHINLQVFKKDNKQYLHNSIISPENHISKHLIETLKAKKSISDNLLKILKL